MNTATITPVERRAELGLTGMTCAACAARIEKTLNRVPGVHATFGMLNPVLAGAAMAASSVSVVGNALLLNRWRPHD